MAGELETGILKAVSRSFYLSLKLLPAPMRRGASIGYLLARASDTIADSSTESPGRCMILLDEFSAQIQGSIEPAPWPDDLISGLEDEGEAELLRQHVDLMKALVSLDPAEAELVREVLAVIIGGQKLDLERFGEASAAKVVALSDAAALEDYTWRVAGCVGVFWTKLGYLTMGEGFSRSPQDELLAHAVDYGKGLQLVNILRDLPKDLRAGRCSLPVADPRDIPLLMGEFEKRREEAMAKVEHGFRYSEKLRGKRLRLSSRLPAMIAKETLEGMKGISFGKLEEGYKVSRKRVYLMILGGFLSV
ncbi:MAG: squalene/phytoene synthase family protein [Luteolibacter sp.]